MQFHLRHLFFATGLAALAAFAMANPWIGVPFGLVAGPAAWRWFHWVGDDLPHFNAVDRAIEIGFALFVSLIVELVLVVWAALAAGAVWLTIVVVAAIAFGGYDRDWTPLALYAVAPAAVVYLGVYAWIYRLTMRG